MIFLDHDEVERLTGCAQKSKQIAWLDEHGYNFDVNAKGYPVILREQVYERQRVARREKVAVLDRNALRERMHGAQASRG